MLPALALHSLIVTRSAWLQRFLGDTQAPVVPHWSVDVQSDAALKASEGTEQENRVLP
jgi:hypothetical protein